MDRGIHIPFQSNLKAFLGNLKACGPCDSSLDNLFRGEHSKRGPILGAIKPKSNKDMDSYPSRCPIEANDLHRTFNPSTGIAPDTFRRASVGRA
jgi:hypothetical protein